MTRRMGTHDPPRGDHRRDCDRVRQKSAVLAAILAGERKTREARVLPGVPGRPGILLALVSRGSIRRNVLFGQASQRRAQLVELG